MTGLASGADAGITTFCLLWQVTRRDGVVLGFTDHDRDVVIGDTLFRAGSGLGASALAQATGLAVDNLEAQGALSDDAIRPEDLQAGRYDGAEVMIWLADWTKPVDRTLRFRGHLGEVVQTGHAFRAEVRGLSAALNRPQGRLYQPDCAAVLGDGACRFDTSRPGYSTTVLVAEVDEARAFRWPSLPGFEPRWFECGRCDVVDGPAGGLQAPIKGDRVDARGRLIELWHPFGVSPRPGDRVRLTAGCDRRAATCREKFDNFLNFRGFPNIPGEDWLAAVPALRAGRT